jgi:hypothetical protein
MILTKRTSLFANGILLFSERVQTNVGFLVYNDQLSAATRTSGTPESDHRKNSGQAGINFLTLVTDETGRVS